MPIATAHFGVGQSPPNSEYVCGEKLMSTHVNALHLDLDLDRRRACVRPCVRVVASAHSAVATRAAAGPGSGAAERTLEDGTERTCSGRRSDAGVLISARSGTETHTKGEGERESHSVRQTDRETERQRDAAGDTSDGLLYHSTLGRRTRERNTGVQLQWCACERTLPLLATLVWPALRPVTAPAD